MLNIQAPTSASNKVTENNHNENAPIFNTYHSTNEELHLFPNPSNQNHVVVQIPSYFNLGSTEIILNDIHGRQIGIQKAMDLYNEVSTQSLPNGIYLVEAKDGIHTKVKKLIIQNN